MSSNLIKDGFIKKLDNIDETYVYSNITFKFATWL